MTADDQERRAEAQARAGEVIEGSGEALTPRHISTMLSLRIDPAVMRKLRSIATARDQSVSTLIRDAIADIVEHADRAEQTVTFSLLTAHTHVPKVGVSSGDVWRYKTAN